MAENAGEIIVRRKKKISLHDKIIAVFTAGNIRK